MSKYLVSVGEIKGEYPCYVCLECADLQEVLETLSELLTFANVKDFILVLGSNILNEASWNERGEAYGDIISADHVLLTVDDLLQKQGLSIEDLNYKIED
jgi:hypothetical protein